MKIKASYFLLFSLFPLFSCELEKTIEVDLPAQEKQLVAEAYLEKGKPLRVLLTETDAYFDTLRFPFADNALLVVNGPEGADTLRAEPFLDLPNRKFYNYTGTRGFTSEGNYELRITSSGRNLRGQSRFLPPPKLDTIEFQYNAAADSAVRMLFWLSDFPGEPSFYRLIMNADSLQGENVLDFTFSDNQLDGKKFPVGTSYRFNRRKKYILRLFHIEAQYYNYLRAISSAERANGNPFAQPSTLRSAMEGNGYGIFTSLNGISRELLP